MRGGAGGQWPPMVLCVGVWLLCAGGCAGVSGDPGASGGARTPLVVFAAASLAEVFDELADQFERERPDTMVLVNLAGSQQLAQQLAQGAPADVFASADERQMAVAVAAGRVAPEAPWTFVTNRLVVVTPADGEGRVRTLEDLAAPGVRVVLAAEEVPAGQYARAFLAKAGQPGELGPAFQERALANVVSLEENVRAVLIKIALGEADAGVVYATDVRAGEAASVRVVEIPDHLNVCGSYWIAPVTDSAHPDLARAFLELVASPAGQAVLAAHGFEPMSLATSPDE